MKLMDISIILVSYNTEKLTYNCIKSIYEKTQGVNFDIWLADNASSDNSVNTIKKNFPKVNIIENKENLGFGTANNLAIKQTNAKYVFLLNTDTILINNAIKILLEFMENPLNSNSGSCGGNLYDENMEYTHSYGKFPTIYKLAIEAIGLKNLFKKHYKEKIITEPKEVDYITGANLMIRKSALDKVGLFDQRFFLYYEETELLYRLKKFGFKSFIVPDAKIIHLCGQSTKNTNLNKIKIAKTSEFLYFKICYGQTTKYLLKSLYFIIYLKHFLTRFLNPKYLKILKIILEM
jgi:GT2 family glycosyltransferase